VVAHRPDYVISSPVMNRDRPGSNDVIIRYHASSLFLMTLRMTGGANKVSKSVAQLKSPAWYLSALSVYHYAECINYGRYLLLVF
jgi:hypothetical protein